jgi:hypothetical protein
VNPRRLRIGEWITGLAGVALLAVMFLGWYDVDHRETFQEPGSAGVRAVTGSVSAWEAFSVFDVMLAICALMAIGVAVMAAMHNTPAVSLAIASLLLTFGTITAIALVVRALFVPELSVDGITVPDEGVSRSIGLWLGLGLSTLVTVGAFASMRDESFPRGARIEVPVETLPPPEGGTA